MSVSELLVQKYLKEIEGQEWYPPLSNARPFTQVNGWNTKKYFARYYDDTLPFPELFVSKDGRGALYLPATKIRALAKEVFVKYWRDPSIREDVLKEYKKLELEVDGFYEKYVMGSGVDRIPMEEIIDDLKKVTDATWSLNARSFFSIYFDRDLAEELLVMVGSGFRKERLCELWEFLSSPVSDSFDTRRKKIFLKVLKEGISFNSLARRLWFFEAAYHYVSGLDEVKEIFFQKYQKWIDADVASRELESENKISEQKEEDWNEKLKGLTDEEQKLAKYLQWIIALRDERKDVIGKFLTIASVVGSNLFEKAGLSHDLLYFAPTSEWTSDLDILREKEPYFRKIGNDAVFLIRWSGDTEVAFGEAEKTLEILKQDMNDGTSKVIKGQIGAPGKAIGKVRIVRDLLHDASSFSDGDILVTGMTRPEFVPLMKRASAIITDEGGITCHAAIVAREMKKPCIIGTKIATQVLHDGDLVEVDACPSSGVVDNGVVRILERNENTESSSQMFRSLNPKDFTKTFESEGTKFLFEDLVNTHYMLLAGEGLSILRKTKIVFVNKKSLAEMRVEGENRTTEMTQEKIRFLDALFEEAKSEASVLVDKECLALDEVVKVFRILGEVFTGYFYFDPWYWDGAYELAKSNERMRENITLVQGYKNVARSKFEPVCFGEGNLMLILLEKLSVQFDVPVGDLDRYREEEILALFANERVSQEELLARKTLCAFYISPDRKAHLMTGGEATDVARWFMNAKLDAVTQLKGTPAHSTGTVVTARVYTIRRDYGNKSATEECINRMQQGEVLVSETTDPEISGAFKKASAVITDLGGLLSHAAITAREYNLPCIVGVANASKILKDGNLVEVDAEKGIVTILERGSVIDSEVAQTRGEQR